MIVEESDQLGRVRVGALSTQATDACVSESSNGDGSSEPHTRLEE